MSREADHRVFVLSPEDMDTIERALHHDAGSLQAQRQTAVLGHVVEANLARVFALMTRLAEGRLSARRTRDYAALRVAQVLNDRKGFHVDGLDEETRQELLDDLVHAAWLEDA